MNIVLTRENAVIEDVKRNYGSIFRDREKARVVVDAEILLEPENRRGILSGYPGE